MMTQKVSKSSIKVSLLWLRHLVAAIVLFFAAQMGWGQTTYTWTGTAGDGLWETATNWTPNGTPGTNTGDIVNIPSAAAITLTADREIAQLWIPNPNNETASFEVSLAGSKTLTVSGKIETYRAAATGAADDAVSNLVFQCNVNSASLIMHSGANITISQGFRANITSIENQGNNNTPETLLTVDGTLISEQIKMSDVTTRKIKVGATGVITTNSISGSSGCVSNEGLIVSQNSPGENLIVNLNGGSNSVSGVAGTVVWTGAVSTDWNEAGNWTDGLPDAGDDVFIPAGRTRNPIVSGGTLNVQTLTNDGSLTVTGGTITATAITNNNTITFTGGTITGTPSITNGPDSTIVYSGSITSPVWGSSYENLQIANGTSITISNDTSVTGNVENNGTITVSSCSLSAVDFSGTGTINLTGGTTVLTAANATTDSAQNSIVLSNTSSTISGNFTLTSFNAATNMNGQSVTLNGSIITAASISLSGASGSLLSLVGDGTNHKFDTSSLAASYLSIDSNIELDNYTTALSDCEPTADSTNQANWVTVLHNGWNIKNLTTLAYTWTGTAGTAWNTAENWDTGFVPATDCKIIIPAVTNLPVLPDTACAGGTLTIDSGASIKLGTANLVLSGNEGSSAGTILTNNGSIIYTGEGRITDNSASPSPINDNIHGTVEYAAGGTPGTVTDFSSGVDTDDYNNLLISGTGWTLADTLKMQTITIANGATCSVNSATTLRAQTFTFNASGDNKNISATADLTLLPYVAANDLTVPSGIGSKFTISSAGKLHLGNASTNSIIFSASDTFKYELNFHAPVTLNQDITVQNSVTANANISGTGELIFAGTGDINFNAGTYAHSRITVNKDAGAGSLTINGNCTLSNLNITSGKTINFAGTPAITNYADTATGGNLLFTNGATFTNAFTRNSGGATQITGTINAASVTLKDTTISGSASIRTSGTQTINGTINGAGTTDNLTLDSGIANITFAGIVGGTTPLASLSITGPSIINCAGITTIGLQSYNGTIQIAVATTLKSNTEIDFTNTISGSQKLTVNTPIFKSAANTDNSISLSEIEFAATSTEIQTNSKKLTFDLSTVSGTGKTIALSSGSELAFVDGISLAPAVANSGTITCTGAATFKGTYSGSAARLTLSNGTTIFESDLDLSDTTFSHTGGSGTVQIGGTSTEVVTITGPTGPQSFSDFETSRSLKILGSNTFNSFTATDLGGKSISFEAGKTQTVNGTLSLSGVSGSLLKLQNEGTGVWTITCSNPTISYVDVINSTSTNSIFADNSNDGGNNTNWNFPGLIYNWVGGTGTTDHENDWNVKTNWDRASVPGHGTIVKIASEKTAKLVDNVDISITPTDTSSIEINGTLDLSVWSLTAGTITNNGTVQLAGKSTQTISGAISSSDTSVVEYNDTNVTFEKFAWDEDSNDTNGKQYKNLTISKQITGNTDALYVAKNLITNNAIEAGSLEVTGTAAINGSSVTTTGAQTYGGAVTSTGAITLQASVINLNGGTVTTTGAQTYKSPVVSTGSITLEGSAINLNGTSVTTVGTQTYKSPVTIETSTELSSDTGNLSFNSTVDGGSLKIIKAGSTTFTGVVNISALTEDDAHAGTITFSNGGTISSAVEFKTPAAVSIFGTMNIGASAPWAAFTHTAGNTLITGTLNAAATQLANTTINGTLNSASVNLSNLTVAGNSTIATTGTQQFTGTIDDSTADTHTLTLNSGTSQITLAGNVGQTKALKEITVTGPVKINCASVKTKDSQTYNSSVTSDGSITLESAAINLNTTSVNTIGSQTYKGAVILQVNGNITLIAKNALDEYQTVQFNENVSSFEAVTPNLILEANTSINCASVTTTGSQTFNGNVSLLKDSELAASQINFAGDISAAGKTLTINTPALNSTKASASTITANQITLSQATTVTSSNGIILSAPTVSGSVLTITNSSALTLGSGINIIPAIVNNGTITCAGTTFFNNNYSGSGSLTLSSGTTEFKGDLDLSAASGFTASGGKVVINPTGDSATVKGPAAFYDFELKKSATINGNNSYNDFTANELSDQVITFAAGCTQTVGGILTLKGTKTGNTINYLTVTGTGTGTWNINCTYGTNDHDIQYVKVYNADNSASAYYLTARNSQDWGGNVQWNFPGMEYTWKGSNDATDGSKWYIAANWAPSSIPGTGSNVTIPADTDTDLIKKLVLEADVNIENSALDQGIITVNGTFDMAGKKLTVTEIINNGLVRANGATGQLITGKMTNGNTSSKVEYYGTGDNNLFWNGKNTTSDKQYEHLHIDRAVTEWNDDIEARGDITIDQAVSLGGDITAATITTNAAFAYTGSSIETSGNQTYTQAVTLSAAPTFKSTGGQIKFMSTLTGTTPATSSLTIETASSEFNGAVTDLALLKTAAIANFNASVSVGSLETRKADINTSTITTTAGGQIYNEEVTLGTDTSLSAWIGNTIEFKKTINGNYSLTTNEKAIFRGAVTIGTLETDKADIYTGTITTQTGGQTYNEEVTLGVASTLNVPANQTIDFKNTISGNFKLTTNEKAIFRGAVTVGTLETQKADIYTAAITTQTGGQTYNDEVTLGVDTTLTVPENQSIDFKKTIGGNHKLITTQTAIFRDSVSIGILETQKADIYTSSIQTTGTQTYKGAVQIQTTTSLSSGGAILFDSKVNGNNKLTLVAGSNDITFNGLVGTSANPITSLSALEITSSGNTLFNQPVYIGSFTDTAASGNITFNNGGTISTATAFSTTGTLTFGDAAGDTMNFGVSPSYVNITHTTASGGDTIITGTLNAAVAKLNNTKLTGTLNAKTMLYGNLTSDGTANFAHDLFVLGDTATLAAATSITAGKDIIIAKASGQDITVSKAISTNGNFVLYSGNLLLNANLTSQKDLVLVGSGYNAKDSSTGYANAYAYNTPRPDGWSTALYVNEGTATPQTLASITLPDTSSVSTKAGSLTASPGVVIHTGKNFYANGITMNGSGTWYIDILKNSDSSVCFAEAYNCTVSNCTVRKHTGSGTTGTEDSDNAQIAAENCTLTSCANWDSEDFEITDAWTVRDNAVYIKFNRPVRNANSELNKFVGRLAYYYSADNDTSYSAFTRDPDGTTNISTESDEVYIIGAGGKTWNTDANGSDIGTAYSTDRNGNHRNAKPYLDIPRSLGGSSATETSQSFVITDRFGKRLLNYSIRTKTSGSTFTNVLDHTGPVLYSVRTGQELHTAYDSAVGESSEHSYDSHNFIEFLYSEKVDFAGSSDDTALNNVDASTDTFVENIQVTDDLGAIKDSITVEGSLSFAGLGTIQNGLIHTGSSGSTDKYVNALYRIGANAEYSVRLSIAGYTDPLNTVTDPDGNTYKKWIGYIEEAVQPTGNVIHLVNASNENICVKDKEGNVQIKYENDSSNTIPVVNKEGQISPIFTSCYGDWDISEPIFAIIRQNIRTLWAAGTFAPDYQAEAIGNNSGVGSTLDRIEFHLYDNSPKFTSGSPEWFTEVGWCNPGSSGLKSELYLANDSYAADIFGGARAFDSTERTSGGIRYSTIVNSAGAFKYGVAGALPSSLFDTTKPVYPGATSLIFTGASNPRRAASDLEGLYFALPLPDSVSFDVKTSFTVSYNENQAYITDLAGNRLRSKTVSTVDRTPPSIDMTISPIGADEIEIVFVKTLVTDSSLIHYITDHVSLQDEPITEQFEYLIGKCFDIITIDSSGAPAVVDSSDLKIDTSSPAKVWVTTNSNNSGFTHIKLKLNRAITLQDIQEKFIRVTYAPPYEEYSVDLFTQKPGSRVTFIQDENGNTIQMYTAHALSDFAVGEVNPLYAYDSSMTLGDGSIISGGLWHTDTSDDVDPQSWAVHDWDRDQKNYGTLPAGHEVALVADSLSAANVNIYLANKPDEKSISTQANKDFEFKTPWRIWLPDLMPDVFASLAEKNNTNFAQKSGRLLDDKANRFIFELDSSITDLWKEGDQVSFLFAITKSDGSPVTIMHSPELDINHDKQYLPGSTKMPLFALRQTDPDDFLSLDLWSFRLKNLVSQKGGVTILNNVIDSSVGEKVVLRVDLPETANLTVLVMTLDGNIVDYLQRGMTSAGEHYYSWNGSNRNGKAVARGMYFIRVMSKGIDETRKVMVVKE